MSTSYCRHFLRKIRNTGAWTHHRKSETLQFEIFYAQSIFKDLLHFWRILREKKRKNRPKLEPIASFPLITINFVWCGVIFPNTYMYFVRISIFLYMTSGFWLCFKCVKCNKLWVFFPAFSIASDTKLCTAIIIAKYASININTLIIMLFELF